LLGRGTDTDDTEGRVVRPANCAACEEITALLPRFTGLIEQIPPQYSAIKVQASAPMTWRGTARTVELQPRPVEIHYFSLVEQLDSSQFVFEAECGKGPMSGRWRATWAGFWAVSAISARCGGRWWARSGIGHDSAGRIGGFM